MARKRLKTSHSDRALLAELEQLIEQNYKRIGTWEWLHGRDFDERFSRRSRLRIEQARQARVAQEARQARMDDCERHLRSWKKPPDALFQEWVEWCVAEMIHPTEKLNYLLRPLKDRLNSLIGEKPKDWDDYPKPPTDQDLKWFNGWEVFDDPGRNPLAAELVTYLEDRRDERRRHQASRSTWRVAERKRADALVDALHAVIKEFWLYYIELTGDEPESDSRIDTVRPLLHEAEERLKNLGPTMVDPPKDEPEGRAMVGPEKDWPVRVQREVLQQLKKVRPWRKYADDWAETEHARKLTAVSEKIVQRLGIRASRGIGSAKPQRPRPPSNPRHQVARRLCNALGVRHLRHPNKPV